LRRLTLVGLALLVVPALAFAGATVTDGNDTLKIKAKFDPAKASKRKSQPRPVELKLDYVAGTTDDSRIADVRSVSIYEGGAVTNYDAFPKCDETDLFEKGPSACPKGSKVGSGRAVAEVHPPGTTTDKTNLPIRVTVFNANNETDRNGDPLDTPKDGILFYTKVGDTHLALPFWAEDGNRRITYYNPQEDAEPGDNALYTVKEVHVTIPRRSRKVGGKQVPWLQAPTKCEGDKQWIVTATNDRYDGGEIEASHAVRCKKA
jgi:hypothetical protein